MLNFDERTIEALFWKSWPDVVPVRSDVSLTQVEAELQCGQTGWSRTSSRPQTARDSQPGSASAGSVFLPSERVRLSNPVRSERAKGGSSYPPALLQNLPTGPRQRRIIMSAAGLWTEPFPSGLSAGLLSLGRLVLTRRGSMTAWNKWWCDLSGSLRPPPHRETVGFLDQNVLCRSKIPDEDSQKAEKERTVRQVGLNPDH